MSDKFVIGLTGNIGTGKSVVRKMLEHMGAYGIDADALSHRAISKGAPGYQLVVDEFGKFILSENGEIDRTKLGKLVFADPQALEKLEEIIHPLVRQATQHLISKVSQEVIVIEAIKLLESPMREQVNAIWVVTAPHDIQIKRLVSKRGMTESQALQRMSTQSPQGEKIAAANVVIKNDKSIDDTWQQVSKAWKADLPDVGEDSGVMQIIATASEPTEIDGELHIKRAKPSQAEDIAKLITRLSGGKRTMTRIDVMEAFGEKAFMLVVTGERIVGVLGWQVENLVAQTDDLWLEQGLNISDALKALMPEVEEASNQLQAEACLAFVTEDIAKDIEVWTGMGYEQRTPESLNVNAWQEAAQNATQTGMRMFFKQLRVDRVLRPI